VAKVTYDAAADTFADAGEGATLAMPNKIIYIERDHLAKLVALYPEREGKDLRELLIMVFRSFGVHSVASALHYLRAYHLVDVLKRTTQEDVELTLLNTPAFEKFDKKKGVFFYREAPPVKEEVIPEAAEAGEEAPRVVLTPEEMALAEAAAETAEPIDEVEAAEAGVVLEDLGKTVLAALSPAKPRIEPPKPAPPPPPKKEKEHKKIKIDTDRRPKTRKSERRVLEEEIREQGSRKEALYAVKEGSDDILAELGVDLSAEQPEEEAAAPAEVKAAPAAAPKPKAEAPPEGEEEEAAAEAAPAEEEEPAPAASGTPGPGGMFGGIFANKLKAALKKKREEAPLEEEEGAAEGEEPEKSEK
jgi:hypothetical protein